MVIILVRMIISLIMLHIWIGSLVLETLLVLPVAVQYVNRKQQQFIHGRHVLQKLYDEFRLVRFIYFYRDDDFEIWPDNLEYVGLFCWIFLWLVVSFEVDFVLIFFKFVDVELVDVEQFFVHTVLPIEWVEVFQTGVPQTR